MLGEQEAAVLWQARETLKRPKGGNYLSASGWLMMLSAELTFQLGLASNSEEETSKVELLILCETKRKSELRHEIMK